MVGLTKLGTGSTRALVWDDDNRLAEVSHAGETLRAFYDAAGIRVVKRGRHGETVFASPYFTLKDADQATKHIFAGPLRVASTLVHFAPSTTPAGALPCSSGPPGLCNAASHGGLGSHARAPHPVSLSGAFVHSGGMSNPPPVVTGGGGGTPTGPTDAGVVYYFHADHLGSTNFLTTEDGTVHEHLEYFPEGDLWVDTGPRTPVNNYRFSAKLFDPETGFYDFGQRYYDPALSLWLTPDPSFMRDQPEGGLDTPSAMSLYAYCRLSPLRFVDRDGRFSGEPLDCDYLGGVSMCTPAYIPAIPPGGTMPDPPTAADVGNFFLGMTIAPHILFAIKTNRAALEILRSDFPDDVKADLLGEVLVAAGIETGMEIAQGIVMVGLGWAVPKILGPAAEAAGEAAADEGARLIGRPAPPGAGGGSAVRFITNPAGTTLDLSAFKGLVRNPGTVAAGRSGAGRALLGPANSYSVTAGGHALVYGPEGRLLYDVSASRIKAFQWYKAPSGHWFPRTGSALKFPEVPQAVLDLLGL
jgi:RHS repeat-associated protein